jgi:hypothetical protein
VRPSVTAFFSEEALPQGVALTLGDIASRIPELREVFWSVTRQPSKCYPCLGGHNPGYDFTEYTLMPDRFTSVVERVVLSDFDLPEDTKFREMSFADEVGYSFVWPKGHGEPPVRVGQDRQTYLVAPFKQDINLSSLLMLFAASFINGMLVRYYPTQWSLLIGHAKGDAAFPLLNEINNTVEKCFPELLLKHLLA